jgi:hypothetical protein
MQPSLPQSPRDRRTEFDAKADERYARVIASGMTISWDDMRAYLEARIAGKTTKRPMARKLSRAWAL